MDGPTRRSPHVLREYALVADGERGALIGPQGDVAWMCAPGWADDAVFSGGAEPLADLHRGEAGCWSARAGSLRVRWAGAPEAHVVESGSDGEYWRFEFTARPGEHRDLVLEFGTSPSNSPWTPTGSGGRPRRRGTTPCRRWLTRRRPGTRRTRRRCCAA